MRLKSHVLENGHRLTTWIELEAISEGWTPDMRCTRTSSPQSRGALGVEEPIEGNGFTMLPAGGLQVEERRHARSRAWNPLWA